MLLNSPKKDLANPPWNISSGTGTETNPQRKELKLTKCDRETIHTLGNVQSHGFLLVVGASNDIHSVSENIEGFLGWTPEEVIGAPIGKVYPRFEEELKPLLEELRANPNQPRELENVELTRGEGDWGRGKGYREDSEQGCKEKGKEDGGTDEMLTDSNSTTLLSNSDRVPLEPQPMYLRVHVNTDGLLLIEVEKNEVFDHKYEYGDRIANLFRTFEEKNEGGGSDKNLLALLETAANNIRATTGYSRVMIYKFGENYHGKVVVESTRDNSETRFLNLRFPSTDIPIPARELFQKNRVRMIEDTLKPISEILPKNPTTAVDLTVCGLRGVSPIHIRYLWNMGVRASLTISLLIGQEKKVFSYSFIRFLLILLNTSCSLVMGIDRVSPRRTKVRKSF
jgi:light-regulated signal transduction histidine kinase (bacteriophytochrome)